MECRRKRKRSGGADERPPVVAAFCDWLRSHRGLAEETLSHYGRNVARVTAVLGEDPSGWTVERLRSYVLALAGSCSAGQMHNVVAAIRSFLRYAGVLGLVPAGMEAGVPTIAGWRLSDLPRYVLPAEVERIIETCDCRRSVGRRDRAILLLLARLGLRASEVAGLHLGDVDWRAGAIRVVGKGRREARLPLPQEVGDAILAYLRRGRPRVAMSPLFLRRPSAGGETGPIRRGTVSTIVRKAMERAGVDAEHRGAHVLRHSLATAMLRSGASLQTIGVVLRHRSIETTAQVAKVDVAALQSVAQAWPEVASW